MNLGLLKIFFLILFFSNQLLSEPLQMKYAKFRLLDKISNKLIDKTIPVNNSDEIETLNGRSLGEMKYSSRTLDIDILYYDDIVDRNLNIPRNEITKFDFVLRPLYDLAPSHIHPETLMTHNKMISETIHKKMIIKKIDLALV